MEYRNEDTGWGWPPYFKMDSSSLNTEAKEVQSTADAPKWVAVTHYGWRIAWMSIYPNAVRVRVVEGPDVSIFPWVNIVILSLFAILAFMVRRMWLQFRERMIEPAVIEAQETFDSIDRRTQGQQITVSAEAADLTFDNFGKHGVVTESFTGMDVGHVQLDHRASEHGQGIANGIAVMGPSASIDQDCVDFVGIGLMNAFAHVTFVVGLKALDLGTQLLA